MKLGRSTLVASVLGSALVVLVPTAATAATYTATKSAGGYLRATAKFNQDGEIYTITDERADGKSGILFKSDVQFSGYYAVTTGAGTSRTVNADLPEGSTVRFAACYGESSSVTEASCGTTRQVTA